MNKWKVLAAYCITALLIMNVFIFSAHAGPFIGPTKQVKAEIIEYAGVDSSKPDTPTSSLEVASEGKYVFVKIDLSKVPPIDEIFIVSARLLFNIIEWSGAGEFGYASVASHYCEDDSWSGTALTWKNKPEFRQQATDTWGFAMIHYGRELDLMIEEDAVKTLESGDKILTEVITWGSGGGHTRLSNPELTIVYASRPVYKLLLDAVCDVSDVNITKTPLVHISVYDQTFGGSMFARPPEVEYASPGTYNLEFQGRCKFSGWQTIGGVSVSNPSEPFTRLTIDSDGELTAKCSLDWINYGSEEVGTPFPLHEFFNSSERYAEKYSPLVTGYLRLVRVYVTENPVPFELHILGMSDDPKKKAPIDIATPVTLTPKDKGWVEADLSSQKIKVERDQAYYISITWLSDEKPVFAGAGSEPFTGLESGAIHLYRFRNNTWEVFFFDILTQHIVSTSLEEPVKFFKISTTTTAATVTVVPKEAPKEAAALFESAIGVVVLMVIIGAIGFGGYKIISRRRKRLTAPPPVAPISPKVPAPKRYCIHCGEEMPEGYIYCDKCGGRQ